MPRWPSPETRLDLRTFKRVQKCLRCPRWVAPESFRGRRTCAECRQADTARHLRALWRRRGLKGYAHRGRDAEGRWLPLLACLLLGACSFETAALDPMLGTSCGHYELNRIMTGDTSACYRDGLQGGECFLSDSGACGNRRATEFPPGAELVLWCPIGNAGTERHPVVPCD